MLARRFFSVSSFCVAAVCFALPTTALAAPQSADLGQPARRNHDAAEVDTPLVGRWDIVTMADTEVEAGVFGFVFNADGSGAWTDGGDEAEPLTYRYDPATDLYQLQIDQEDVVTFRVTFEGDEAVLTTVDAGPGYPPLGLRRASQD